jgi:hypothetical protein
MTKLFKISELEPNKEVNENKSSSSIIKFEKSHLIKTESLKNIAPLLPGSDEIIFLWSLKSFNAFTFITYIIKYAGAIDQLTISTYSLNNRILTSLIRQYDNGHIKNIELLISDSIKFRLPKLNDLIQSQASTRNITVLYSWNHSKITLLRVKDFYFCVEGSGNFSENALHEQYIFTNNKKLYEFRKSCITEAAI